MDARGMAAGGSVLTGHPARSFELAQFARAWWSALSLSGGFLLLAFALLMLARRFQGGLTTPLTPAELVGVGALLAFLAAVMHRGVQVCWRGKTVWFWVVQSLPFVGLASSAAAVSLPGSSPYGICAMVALLAMEEGYWLRGVIRRDKRRPRKFWRRPQVRTRPLSLENDPFSNSDSQGLPEGVSHRIERIRGECDQDICRGQVRSQFQLGQRTESIHLAFCPPFAVTPQLHFEQINGPDSTIKAMQILPYGARLEIRLAKTYTQPVQTTLEFSAISD